jgi:hypothetical protein
LIGTRDPAHVCREHNIEPDPPSHSSKVGIAIATLHLDPLNGLRHPAVGGSCGWYIWGGALSGADDFFQSLHVAHLAEVCPRVLPFLSLPAGWRFLLGQDSHVDVWNDPTLLVM